MSFSKFILVLILFELVFVAGLFVATQFLL